jgi:ATP-dependent Zn protease
MIRPRPHSFVAPYDDGLPPVFQRQPYSEATAGLIDAEVRRTGEDCQGEATRLLAENRDKLVGLTVALLKAESLDEREIVEVTGLGPPPARAAVA